MSTILCLMVATIAVVLLLKDDYKNYKESNEQIS